MSADFRFADELEALAVSGKFAAFRDAIEDVTEAYDLDVNTRRVLVLMATLQMQRLSAGDVRQASRLLIRDSDFRESVRYGAKLQAVDFHKALDAAPDTDALYTSEQVDEFGDRLGVERERFKRVKDPDFQANCYRYFPPDDG